VKRRLCALALQLSVALAACSGPRFREGGPWPPPRAGMVVCQEPHATAVGVAILERGGNAADAAVATALALAVVHPQAGNLGGGGFAVWVAHDPALEPLFLDFRECAPAALKPELFLDEQGNRVAARSLESGLAVGVPGSPRGLFEFHKKLGRLPFREVVAPAIALARDGFVIDRWLAADLLEERDKLARHAGAKELFFAGDAPLPAGARLVQAELARTLERYAAGGADGFYLGEVAQRVVAEIGNEQGVASLADFAEYKAQWRTPLRGWFRGLEIVTAPPPSSGGIALLQMLSMLDGFPVDEERVRELRDDPADPVGLSSRALHWWVESMRLAFADRAEYLGDPDFFPVPVEALLSPARINRLRVHIGEHRQSARQRAAAAAGAAREGGQTTHLSVLDAEGNAVSLTTTLNTTFGAGILARGAGLLLNNEIDDFAIVAGSPNEYGLVGGEANALRRAQASAVVDDAGGRARRRPGGEVRARQPGRADDHHQRARGALAHRGLRPGPRHRRGGAAPAPAVAPERDEGRARLERAPAAGPQEPRPRDRRRSGSVGQRAGDRGRGRRRAGGCQRSRTGGSAGRAKAKRE
jgi:gamma-glutamyltranspeptidase/glutathione hydrolase